MVASRIMRRGRFEDADRSERPASVRWPRLATAVAPDPALVADLEDVSAAPDRLGMGARAGRGAGGHLARDVGGLAAGPGTDARQTRRRTIYDSRDVYMLSREVARLGDPLRSILAWCERRWARDVDQVLTVNEPCADLLVDQLAVPRADVVLNCRRPGTSRSRHRISSG